MQKPTFLSLLWIVLTVGPLALAQPPISSSVACIQSLCGTANPLAHPFEGNKQLEDASTTMVTQQLGRPVQNYMGRIIREALFQDRLYLAMINQKDKISVPQANQSLLLSFRYVDQLNSFYTAFEPNQAGEMVLNRAKLKELKPQLSEPEINAIDSLKSVVGLVMGYQSLFQRPLEVVLKSFGKQQSFSETQKQFSQFMIQMDAVLQNAAPKLKFHPNIVLTKAATGAALSESEKANFKRHLFRSMIISQLIQPEVQQAFSQLPLDISAIIAEFKNSYSQSKRYQAIHNPQSIKQIFQDGVGQCTKLLSFAYGALPTVAQEDAFKTSFENIRLTAQKMMEEKTKMSLATAFQIQILLPQSQENFLPDLKNILTESITSFDEVYRDQKKLDVNDPEVLSSVFTQAATFSDTGLLDEALEFCDQARPPELNDSALSELKMVNLSWPTIRYPEYGVGIIAHELGHVASGNWNAVLTKEKSCLQEKQSGNHYLEEDFADLFSTEVTRRLGYNDNGVVLKNFACALQSRNDSGWADGVLKNPDPSDTHSSDFYRLMVVASRSGTLTNQCQAELQSQKEVRFNSYCQWQP